MDSSTDLMPSNLSEMEKEDKSANDIAKTRTRYLMLFFACFLCFGNYFIYDNPSALQTQLEDVIFP
jgi:hypothetical protein